LIPQECPLEQHLHLLYSPLKGLPLVAQCRSYPTLNVLRGTKLILLELAYDVHMVFLKCRIVYSYTVYIQTGNLPGKPGSIS
jgi:hypothetical protein